MLVDEYNNQIEEKNRELAALRDSERRLSEMAGRLQALEEELAHLRKSAANGDNGNLVDRLIPAIKSAIEESIASSLPQVSDKVSAVDGNPEGEKASASDGRQKPPEEELLSDPKIREPGR